MAFLNQERPNSLKTRSRGDIFGSHFGACGTAAPLCPFDYGMGKGEHDSLSRLSRVLLLCAGAVYKVVRRPGAGELHAALLQFKGGRGVFILITLDGLVIDQMGDIQKHLA